MIIKLQRDQYPFPQAFFGEVELRAFARRDQLILLWFTHNQAIRLPNIAEITAATQNTTITAISGIGLVG